MLPYSLFLHRFVLHCKKKKYETSLQCIYLKCCNMLHDSSTCYDALRLRLWLTYSTQCDGWGREKKRNTLKGGLLPSFSTSAVNWISYAALKASNHHLPLNTSMDNNWNWVQNWSLEWNRKEEENKQLKTNKQNWVLCCDSEHDEKMTCLNTVAKETLIDSTNSISQQSITNDRPGKCTGGTKILNETRFNELKVSSLSSAPFR